MLEIESIMFYSEQRSRERNDKSENLCKQKRKWANNFESYLDTKLRMPKKNAEEF